MSPREHATDSMRIRIGHGFDSHGFGEGIPLMLGGLHLPHGRGLSGHSDGDVLLHAVADALFGALASDDIGAHFPPSDPRWKGADSSAFVRHAIELARAQGWRIENLDTTLILQEPRVQPHRTALRQSLAALLDIPVESVSVKAKTPEGLDLADTAMAHAVVLLARE